MFPAAFDVEVRSDQPVGPDAPSTPETGTDSGEADASTGDDGTSTPSDSAGAGASTPSPSPTPTATSTPAASGGADGEGSSASGGSAGLFGLLALGLVGVSVLIAVAAVASADRGSSPWLPTVRLPAVVSRLSLPTLSLTQIPQVTTLAIISAGSGLARLADDVGVVADALGRSFAAGIGPVASGLGRALAALPRALGALLVAPFSALGAIGAVLSTDGVRGFLSGGVSGPTFLDDEKPASDARAAGGPEPDTDDAEDEEPVDSVLEAWVAMTELVTVRNRRTRTPVEYAQRAIDAGLPAGPVRRLTALFREVRYGGRADSGERVTAARRALDALTGGDE